jgi:hypothetical protein
MKSDRIIKRGVTLGGHTYLPGEEDELGAVLTSEEAKRLVDNGTLEGAWKGTAKAEPVKPAVK